MISGDAPVIGAGQLVGPMASRSPHGNHSAFETSRRSSERSREIAPTDSTGQTQRGQLNGAHATAQNRLKIAQTDFMPQRWDETDFESRSGFPGNASGSDHQ